MARVSAFQADCYGFESHRPLHFDLLYEIIFWSTQEKNIFLGPNTSILISFFKGV